jgi:archaellum component FlaG (FlaF/FlaG flagellin family)
MYGPSTKDIIWFILVVLITGAVIGVLLFEGYVYLHQHLEVKWLP